MSSLKRVYVWELPVRFFHWINVLAVIVLIVTGLWIADPPALYSQKEASFSYTMGTVRYIHFIAAYIFLFTFIIRIYWGFVGNRYAKWINFIPLKRKQLQDIVKVLKIDILLKKDAEHLAVGHNQLSSLIYIVLFLAMILMIITGFGLYAPMSDWWLPNLFAWSEGVFGSPFALRNIHHSSMWIFILFTIVHIYLVLYHDAVEGRGELSSIIGGWKFIESEHFDEEGKPEPEKTIV